MSATTSPRKWLRSDCRYCPRFELPKSSESMSSSRRASASKSAPSQSPTARSLRRNTYQPSGGSAISIPSVERTGRNRKWLNAECSSTAAARPGRNAVSARPLLRKGDGDDREDRGRAAVHDRGAEAAHHPHGHVRIRPHRQVVQVLHHREPGADGEPGDRRVDQERDALRADQHHDDECLQRFLDHGRYIAGIGRRTRDRAVRVPAMLRK